MRQHHLETAYCHGKHLTEYLYFHRRSDDKTTCTEPHRGWLIDFPSDNGVTGIEFMHASPVDLAAVRTVLLACHQLPLSRSTTYDLSLSQSPF